MNKTANDLLMLGITFLIMGLLLMSYSLSTYKEVKVLGEKIDFEELDNNVQMSMSDKYFKYLSNSDFLNQKLNKNKNLWIKNASCVYLDYAQHNAISLYRLTYSGLQTEESRKSVAAGNVRALYNMLDNYKTCQQASSYKTELKNILDDIQKSDILYSHREDRMESFLNGYDPHSAKDQSAEAAIAQDLYPQEKTENTNPSEGVSSNYNNDEQASDIMIETDSNYLRQE